MPPETFMSLNSRRASARQEASECLVLSGASYRARAWTLNVSEGGLRVVVEDPISVGAVVDVGRLGTAPRLARVVWIQDEPDGQIIGLQFVERAPA